MIGNIVAGTLSVSTPPPFVPTDISNLYLWLDADDASTFTYSSGTVISQWNDKSGNGYHATQATVSKQPSRVTSPSIGVDFDGSNDVLSTTATYNGAAFTQFSVVRNFDSAPGGFNTIIGKGSGGDSIYWPYMSVNDWYFQVNANWGTVNVTPPAGLFNLELRYDGGGATNADKMKGRISGSDRTLAFTGTIPATLSRAGQTTAVGAFDFTPALPFPGILSELITYNKVLNNTELTQVRNYLSTKWGITA
jgi:hypothetical protein